MDVVSNLNRKLNTFSHRHACEVVVYECIAVINAYLFCTAISPAWVRYLAGRIPRAYDNN